MHVNTPFLQFHNLALYLQMLTDTCRCLHIVADACRPLQTIADHCRSLQIIADTCSHQQHSHYHWQLPAVLAIVKYTSNKGHSGDLITHHLYFYLTSFYFTPISYFSLPNYWANVTPHLPTFYIFVSLFHTQLFASYYIISSSKQGKGGKPTDKLPQF